MAGYMTHCWDILGEGGGRLLECGAETFVYFPDSLAWRLQKGDRRGEHDFPELCKTGEG